MPRGVWHGEGKHEKAGERVLKNLPALLKHRAIYTDPEPGHETKQIILWNGYAAVIQIVRTRLDGSWVEEPWLLTTYWHACNAGTGRDAPPAGSQTVSPAEPETADGPLSAEPGVNGNIKCRKLVVKRNSDLSKAR